MTHADFHQIKRTLCLRFGGSETSGMRSLERNQAVGGADESRHLYDEASDIVLDNWGLWRAFAKEAKRRGLGVVVNHTKHYIHIQIPKG